MDIIHALEDAIDTYPTANVTITLPGTLDFVGPGSGTDVINDEDVFSFDVAVRNSGHLNMKDTVLRIEGSKWALVNYQHDEATGKILVPEQFLPMALSPPQDIAAGKNAVFGKFYMKAVNPTPSRESDSTLIVYDRSLFSIRVDSFHANLADIMIGQPSGPSVDYVDVVLPI